MAPCSRSRPSCPLLLVLGLVIHKRTKICCPYEYDKKMAVPWPPSYRSLLLLLLCTYCFSSVVGTGDGAELPSPSITACDFARLRYSHVDDLFSVDELCPSSGEGTLVYPSDQPAAAAEDDGLVVTDALGQMWDAVVGHGWEQARRQADIPVDGGGIYALTEDSIAGDVTTGEIIERAHQIDTNNAYPFLACVATSTSSSTYAGVASGNARLQVLLPKIRSMTSKVVVVSNKEKESCFVVTTTADNALALVNALDDEDEKNDDDDDDAVIKVIPLVDAMKLEPSLPTEVCYNPEWMIPPHADDEEATWERSIHVTLRADLADTFASNSRSVLHTAQRILEDIKSWGLVGNRRRRQRRVEEERGSLRKANQNDYIPDRERSLSDLFSLTSTVASALEPKGSIAEFWSRELTQGLEADHLCAAMFEELGIQARFGNAGFSIILNPYAKQQKSASEGGPDQGQISKNDSVRNPSCVCSLISALAAHPYVVDVSTNRPIELHGTNGNVQGLVQSGNGAQKPFNAAGITGRGEVVGVIDSGVNVNHCYFRDVSNRGGSIFGTSWNMDATKVLHYDDVWYDSIDNSGHGTHVAGTIAGKPSQGTSPVGNGVAEDAKLAVFDFAISASGSFDPGVDRLFTSLYNNGKGAKVINGSWGRKGSGVYSAECRDMDDALAQYEDILYVASAGNMGSWRTINSPADCKSTLAVGASFNQNGASRDRLISYSSRGPTADGRIKPDVVAPGFSIQSSSGGACGWRSIDGTSMSAPGVSGAAALVRQYLREGFLDGGYRGSGEGFDPSGSLVKAILMNSGRSISHVFTRQGKVAGTSRAYDNSQGHGAVQLTNTLPLQGINDLSAFAVDNAVISDAQTFTFEVDTTQCNSNIEPFGGRSSNKIVSVTLAWYDPPAQVGSKQSLVNDLDLWVEGPKGEILHSNGLSQKDRKNTVERVRWTVTTDGVWRIKIGAHNLATASQKFSVFGSGCFSTDPHPTPRRSDTTIHGHLDSLFIGGVRNSGAYFDLVAKEGLEVETFYIHTPLKTTFDVWVYSTDGTWQGKERTPWEWSGVQVKGVQGRGAGLATPIEIPRLMIRGGQTKGIYIDMVSHRDLRYSAVEGTVGSVYSENRDLQILVGAGADPNFSMAYPQRMANIRVRYKRHSPYDRLQAGSSSSLPPTTTPLQTQALTGHHSLSTQEVLGQLSFSTSNGSMFNIRAKDKKISLKSFEVNLESPPTQLTTFHIFERNGSHIGYEQSPEEWNVTGVVRVKATTTGSITSIPLDIFDSPITIEAGAVRGIYITTLETSPALLRSTLIRDKMVGEVAVENEDMEIQVGTSNDSGFGEFRLQRVIDIQVNYEM